MGLNLERFLIGNILTNLLDCANAIGDYMLHWEPIRGQAMFDGTVILKSADGAVIGKCQTKTVRVRSVTSNAAALPYFVTVQSEAEGIEFNKNVGNGIRWYTEAKSTDVLKSSEWQAIFHKYFQLSCDAPVA